MHITFLIPQNRKQVFIMSRTLPIRLDSEISQQLEDESKATNVSQSKLLQKAYLERDILKADLDTTRNCCLANFSNHIDYQIGKILKKDYLGMPYKKLNCLLRISTTINDFCKHFLKLQEKGTITETFYQYWTFFSQNCFYIEDNYPIDFLEKPQEYLETWRQTFDTCSINGYASQKLQKYILNDFDRIQKLIITNDQEFINTVTEFSNALEKK